MNAIQAVSEVSRQIQSVKERGGTEVTVESLEKYLTALSANIEQRAPLEQANIDFQKQANEYAYQSEQAMFRTVIDSGQWALKSGLLIGGGAAAALLAFASSAWRSLTSEGLALLGLTVFLLAIGVLLVAIAGSMTYLSQSFYHAGLAGADDCREDRIADLFRIAACVLVAGSYCLYAWSGWNVYRMMGSFAVSPFIPVS
ncbi:hypothetical protein F2A37_16570 [Pseudomonas chlororaphis]|uniref:hypothetical protein n=1 Tax=Pseudomonas chlororaphis TaxID=587753 RepID=UPI0012325D86|nr:hypothetical protein [Pseudomonas chlororaphis]KAA5842281.1 hypothetical protein F2A37_16570 [Pseudomonas chlororaphis]